MNRPWEGRSGEPEAARRSRRPRIAFVIQRCGDDVNGGAELHCLQIAQRMRKYWDTEILTTCAIDYVSWANHYAQGLENLRGVKVRRFPVSEPREIEYFNRISKQIRGETKARIDEQEAWMRAQGPWSPALLDFISTNENGYDAFIFFGYLYAQSYFGLPRVERKSVLVPLAHEEWMIQLSMWDRFFQRPAGFVFNSPEERDYLKSRFPRATLTGPVLGVGVDRPDGIDPLRFRKRYKIDDDYLLYVGRIDPSKGCNDLFNYFLRHIGETADTRKLVLLGKPVMPLPEHQQIVSLGYVDDQTKWDALAGCDLLVMPSPYESLSMALLEAWAVSKPVLVNGECAVLKAQCNRANGGVWYQIYEEFTAALSVLARGPYSSVLGQQGYSFVNSAYGWERIEEGYQATLDALEQQTRRMPSVASPATVTD